jgi:DNA-binding beta-propeller fold protein YncE
MKFAAVLICIFVMPSLLPAKSWISPQHLTSNAKTGTVFISLSTASAIAVYDAHSQSLLRQIELPDNPNGLAVDSTGTLLYAAGAERHKVYRISMEDGSIQDSVSVGHNPYDLALSSDGRYLWLTNRFSSDISVISTRDFREIQRIPAIREPFALAISPNDSIVAVCNFLPFGSMNTDGGMAAEITLISADKMAVIRNISLPGGSNALYDLCFSPDGRFIYVTHILARFQLPTVQLDRGWMNTNALSIIDAENRSYMNTILLDDVDRGAANPAGLAVSEDGKWLFAAVSGTHELCILDLHKLHNSLPAAKIASSGGDGNYTGGDISRDLSFTADMKQRIPLQGKGPRYLAVAEGKVYITDYFSAGMDVFDPKTGKSAGFVALGDEPDMTDARIGELFFHDASFCFQSWQSCASCHPGNARSDGLNWDLLNDGIGNPKSTKSLLLAHRTPPAMITGIRADAETAVRAGLRYIQFVERPESDAGKIDAYLKNLQPLASPFLSSNKLSNAAVRGRQIFQDAECGNCHSGESFTDGRQYDVGTGTDRHKTTEFDTPTLIEVWRTAPYLYDGRAATLRDVFTEWNKEDRHGKTSQLSAQELADLIEYIKSF